MNGLKELAEQVGMHYRQFEDEFCKADTDGVPMEMLDAFAKAVRFQAADDAWIEMVKHGVGWALRKAVTDAIHARDKT
jgi:hypothetical protein